MTEVKALALHVADPVQSLELNVLQGPGVAAEESPK